MCIPAECLLPKLKGSLSLGIMVQKWISSSPESLFFLDRLWDSYQPEDCSVNNINDSRVYPFSSKASFADLIAVFVSLTPSAEAPV